MTFPPTTLKIATRHDRDGLILELAGELDIATHQKLRDHIELAFDTDTTPALTIDASELAFTDCTGLGALVWASNYAALHGAAFQLRNPPARLVRLLNISGLTARLSGDRLARFTPSRHPAASVPA